MLFDRRKNPCQLSDTPENFVATIDTPKQAAMVKRNPQRKIVIAALLLVASAVLAGYLTTAGSEGTSASRGGVGQRRPRVMLIESACCAAVCSARIVTLVLAPSALSSAAVDTEELYDR
jgi:hypothetical protein